MQKHLIRVSGRGRCVKRQSGITLIEALVALFIMSIGLLGVAGLQATSISAGHASTQRSQAVFLSYDIADRMRANRTAIATYATAITPAGKNNNCGDTSGTDATFCSAVQMAEEDILYWRAALTDAFTGMSPVPTITVDSTTSPPTVTVDIDWKERGKDMEYITNLRI